MISPIYPPEAIWARGATAGFRLDRVDEVHAVPQSLGDPDCPEGPRTVWTVMAQCGDEMIDLLEIPRNGTFPEQKALAQSCLDWITKWMAYRPTLHVDFRLVLQALEAGTTVEELVELSDQEMEAEARSMQEEMEKAQKEA